MILLHSFIIGEGRAVNSVRNVFSAAVVQYSCITDGGQASIRVRHALG